MHRKFSRQIRLFFFGLLCLLLIFSGESPRSLAAPNLLPVTIENAPFLLESIIKAKLIPFQIEKGGIQLTITKLQHFDLNWEDNQMEVDCLFDVAWQQGVRMHQSGSLVLSGVGLLAEGEQKIGGRITRVKELHLDYLPDLVNTTVRYILDQTLAGKEFWYGEPPKKPGVPLTRENYVQLIRTTVVQKLPISQTFDRSEFTLESLKDFAFLDDSGLLKATIELDGTYRRAIFSFPFEGEISLEAHIYIDPGRMTGLIHINRITDVKFRKCSGMVERMIRSSLNKKLSREEFPFSWQ